jgi:hypothetical protein
VCCNEYKKTVEKRPRRISQKEWFNAGYQNAIFYEEDFNGSSKNDGKNRGGSQRN